MAENSATSGTLKKSAPLAERDVMSITEFCEQHGCSAGYYFKLQRLGLGPRTIKVGGRVFISKAAVRDWLAARETAA
jgi:hypothetical protein